MAETGAIRRTLLEGLETASAALRSTLDALPDDAFESTLPSGWSPKEMAGHLAFWAECTKPVVVGLLRGDAAAIADWRFGSGFVAAADEPWPAASVHNAREAAWARTRSRADVLARLSDALVTAREVIGDLQPDEEHDPKFVDHLEGTIAHLREHHEELLARSTPPVTVFEAVGGEDGLRRLAAAWHARAVADEVVGHAFSHGYHPDHTERLAAYWGEALGGPPLYTSRYGDETSVVRIHSGNGVHEEMDARAIDCFDQAMVDTGLDADPRLRQVLHEYFAWATTTAMAKYPHSADDVPDALQIARWTWSGATEEGA